jgi:hypothetical protein
MQFVVNRERRRSAFGLVKACNPISSIRAKDPWICPTQILSSSRSRAMIFVNKSRSKEDERRLFLDFSSGERISPETDRKAEA